MCRVNRSLQQTGESDSEMFFFLAKRGFDFSLFSEGEQTEGSLLFRNTHLQQLVIIFSDKVLEYYSEDKRHGERTHHF